MRTAAQTDPSTATPPARSMLKRLFDRQLLRISPAERLPSSSAAGEKDEAESVCLDGMVRSFLEDGGGVAPEKPGHGGRYCNCFHGGDNSDDEDDDEAAASSDAAETIKVGTFASFLLIVGEKFRWPPSKELTFNIICAAACAGPGPLRDAPGTQPPRRRVRAPGAPPRVGGRAAATCSSLWPPRCGPRAETPPCASRAGTSRRPTQRASTRTSTCCCPPRRTAGRGSACWWTWTSGPRSRWPDPPRRTARCCSGCRRCSWGKEDRLRLLVAAAADAARASLKKRGLHLPPWRKPEYMRAKWLSPYNREEAAPPPDESPAADDKVQAA
ncbi:hypothetical protein PR202_gb08019 [Eleusine coracana subsp. coracana]|uniref:Uncharacterized protein n=1 Tax=Eleusine coracana subsp. coracana TaxID=191504 RepID=A0AAV5EDK9_ELECO|nr:hypothetical protein PR202_gb08019 [Eleusine coracana subsp. coracana]